MMIRVFSEEIDFCYNHNHHLNSWVAKILNQENRTCQDLNIIFCNDDYLLQINQKYLCHDYYTDIITFQYEQDPIEGELFISIDRVRENAIERQLEFNNELHRVIAHGILHLVGYGDKSDSERTLMRAKEEKYLGQASQWLDADTH